MAWFPEKNDPEVERLAGIIFDLRRMLFLKTEHSYAHEREWETEEQEKQRENRNAEKIMKWDNDTRRIIMGD